MEVGGRGRVGIPIATLSPPELPALRWAAMRDILMFHYNCEGQSHKTVSTNHNRFEEKGEPKRRYQSNRGVLPLTSLPPYRWAKPALSEMKVSKHGA